MATRKKNRLIDIAVIASVVLGIAAVTVYYLVWQLKGVKLSPILYYSLMVEIAVLAYKAKESYSDVKVRALLVFAGTSHACMAVSLCYYYLSFGMFRTLPFTSFGIGLLIGTAYYIVKLIKTKKLW